MRGAEYLLRFDDLCPTMDMGAWERFTPMLARHSIKPILAIVPANEDTGFMRGAPDEGFWNEMRGWQSAGAAIGLHGYRHLCVAQGRGLVPFHRETEFAGVAEAEQREWIGKGVEILRGNGLEPTVWVAPRHGFGGVTLKCLRDAGICVLSDGLGTVPWRDGGMTWIPQQLWGPVEKRRGLWTICLHANTASAAVVEGLEGFLEGFAGQFTSVEQVLTDWPAGERGLGERVVAAGMMGRLRLRRWLKG